MSTHRRPARDYTHRLTRSQVEVYSAANLVFTTFILELHSALTEPRPGGSKLGEGLARPSRVGCGLPVGSSALPTTGSVLLCMF